jgi:hypothetical protein
MNIILMSILKNTIQIIVTSVVFSLCLFSNIGVVAGSILSQGQSVNPTGDFVNVRDKNCNKIGSVTHTQVFFISSNDTMTCKIGDITYTYVSVNTPLTLVGDPNSGQTFVVGNLVKVIGKLPISKNGYYTNYTRVNFRDDNCGRFDSIPDNSQLQSTGKGFAGEKICTINGEELHFTQIIYNTTVGWIATDYLK